MEQRSSPISPWVRHAFRRPLRLFSRARSGSSAGILWWQSGAARKLAAAPEAMQELKRILMLRRASWWTGGPGGRQSVDHQLAVRLHALSAQPMPIEDRMTPHKARRPTRSRNTIDIAVEAVVAVRDDTEVFIAGLGVGDAPGAGGPSKFISFW